MAKSSSAVPRAKPRPSNKMILKALAKRLAVASGEVVDTCIGISGADGLPAPVKASVDKVLFLRALIAEAEGKNQVEAEVE